jgi:hypothetical protein
MNAINMEHHFLAAFRGGSANSWLRAFGRTGTAFRSHSRRNERHHTTANKANREAQDYEDESTRHFVSLKDRSELAMPRYYSARGRTSLRSRAALSGFEGFYGTRDAIVHFRRAGGFHGVVVGGLRIESGNAYPEVHFRMGRVAAIRK